MTTATATPVPAFTSQSAAEAVTFTTTAQVAFNSGGQTDTYKVPQGLALAPLDAVVVEVGARGLTVGRVASLGDQHAIDPHAKFTYKWIVAKVDRIGYDAILAAEAFLKGPAPAALSLVDGEVVG